MPTEEEFRKAAETLNAMAVPKRSEAEMQMLAELNKRVMSVNIVERLRAMQDATEAGQPTAFVKDIWQCAADEILRLRGLVEDINDAFDSQLHNDQYIKSCRDNGMDIAPECEHVIVIREELRQKIKKAAES
jgi:hypothetical protein